MNNINKTSLLENCYKICPCNFIRCSYFQKLLPSFQKELKSFSDFSIIICSNYIEKKLKETKMLQMINIIEKE
jgi:hypothetical protein